MLKKRFTFKKDVPIYGDRPSPTINLKDHVFIEEHPTYTEKDFRPNPVRSVAGPAITRLYEFEELGMEPDELMVMIQECKAAHATKMLECEICGMKFEPTKERHYVIQRCSSPLFANMNVNLGDAFDCPKCGCQVSAGMRYDRLIRLADFGSEEKEEE